MLRSLCLQRLRCFQNTGQLSLRRLNIFVGANNSGKSTLLSAVELMTSDGDSTTIPTLLASFDSSVRQQWSPGERRPTSFAIEAQYSTTGESIYSVSHEYTRRTDDGSAFVRKARHRISKSDSYEGAEALFNSNRRDSPRDGYNVQTSLVKSPGRALQLRRAKLHYDLQIAYEIGFGLAGMKTGFRPDFGDCSVIRPSRLLPRPVYLLDDPTLDEFDREVISALRSMWQDTKDISSRTRVVNALKSLGLIATMQAKPGTLRGGRSRTVEVRVATHKRRAESSLADVGFGVSQVLPLVVADAQLSNGTLIAYQPEVHLHPYAQSRLADFFANSTKRGNQIFVETHSEHLILRVQYLIAKGILEPNDISIFFLENQEGESQIVRVGLDRKGIPDRPWPSGFLDVGLALARDLTSARIQE